MSADKGRRPVLSVQDLRVELPTPRGVAVAVRGVSFEMFPGETFALVGESGSGKSTTCRAILQLVHEPGRIAGGSVIFREQDLTRLSGGALQKVRGKGIAMIFQDATAALHPLLTIEQQLMETLLLERPRPEARAAALSLLRQVGIPDPTYKLAQYPHQLSGGQCQRVAIAIALARGPELLLADEPTTAVDVTLQDEILMLLAELREARGMALLLITHDLGVVSRAADRVGVMYAGQIVEMAGAQALFRRPAHPYTIGLLRSLPRAEDEDRAPLLPIPGSPPDPVHLPRGCAFAPRCAWAESTCRQSEPPAVELAEGHVSRCHRALEIYSEAREELRG